MKTPHCQADAATLGEAAARLLHSKCPGATMLLPSGTKVPCSCRLCHGPFDELDPHAVLPMVDERAQTAPATGGGAQARPASRRPTKAAKEATNDCLCGCGAKVRSRFLPGHDAKLKSQLLRVARSLDPLADREGARRRLEELGWTRFLGEDR